MMLVRVGGDAQAVIHPVLRKSSRPQGAQDAVIPPHIHRRETEGLFQEEYRLASVSVSADGDVHEQEKC